MLITIRTEHIDCLVRPEIKALVAKGNISLNVFQQLRMNSYEMWTVYPALSDRALAHVISEHLKHVAPFGKLPSTYDETCLHVLLPLLLDRFEKAFAPLVPMLQEVENRINNDPII